MYVYIYDITVRNSNTKSKYPDKNEIRCKFE